MDMKELQTSERISGHDRIAKASLVSKSCNENFRQGVKSVSSY